MVDTVGAGDAFSAVFILGLSKGWSTALTLERALEFAAAVCTVLAPPSGRSSVSTPNSEDRGWW